MRGFREHKECCGTCKWHRHEDIDDGWVCVNDMSDQCAEWTDYDMYCDQYEPRDFREELLERLRGI